LLEMLLALIDVGSNSVRCLLVRRQGTEVAPVAHLARTTRLGAGLREGGSIAAENLAATGNALAEFVKRAREMGAERIEAVGTAPLRQSDNAAEALRALEWEGGVAVRVLSSEEEASLTFLGATRSLPRVAEGKALTGDLGGLSLELAAGTAGRLEWSTSLPLGCRILTEAYGTDRATGEPERGRLLEHVRTALSGVKGPEPLPRVFIAFGGAPTGLVAWREGMVVYNGDRVHGSLLGRKELAEYARRLGEMTLEKRGEALNGDPDADIIVAGALVLVGVLDWAGLDECVVSDRGLLTGLAYALLEKGEL